MCHVLSEGSKWSGLGRPCGLLPCAPRYYYSTPRCPIVYGLVLSSVCGVCCACVPMSLCLCAFAVAVCPCPLPVPCAWCVRGCVWCCACPPVLPCLWYCPVLYAPCYTLPLLFSPLIPPVYMGCIKYPYTQTVVLSYVGVDFLSYYFTFANAEHTFVYVSADIFPCL